MNSLIFEEFINDLNDLNLLNELKTIAGPEPSIEEIKNYVKENKRDCLTKIQNQRIKVMLMLEHPTYNYEIYGDLEKTYCISKNDYFLKYITNGSIHKIIFKKNDNIINKKIFYSKPHSSFLIIENAGYECMNILDVLQYLLDITIS